MATDYLPSAQTPITMPLDSMLTTFATGVGLIGLCSAPALSSTVKRFTRRQERKQDVYEDEDGSATPESMAAYSAKIPKALVLTSAGVGLAVSTTLLVISSGTHGEPVLDGLGIGAWVSLIGS
jgi:hypothetical protein